MSMGNNSTKTQVLPTTRKGRETYERQLEVARRVFARDGFSGTTMSAVAKEAKISLGGLYRYFADKDDLFMAVLQRLHGKFYESSGRPQHSLVDSPYAALLESNLGYLRYYKDNSGLMHTFMEAATRDTKFRDFWWYMRNRHVDRFLAALKAHYDVSEADMLPARRLAEAAACMSEQCAYVWFAQDELNDAPVSIEVAANIITRCWYTLFFGNDFASPNLVIPTDLEETTDILAKTQGSGALN